MELSQTDSGGSFDLETIARQTYSAGDLSTGAACVTRTRDPRITNAVLYRLS